MRNRTLTLPKGGTAAFPAPMNITCQTGLVWATIEGSTTDYILEAGRTVRFDRKGSVVIQALHSATVRVERGQDPEALSAYPPGSRTISNTPVAVP